MQGGKYHCQIAVIYRNSYLISSILASSEVWYGVTQSEYEQLEAVDEMFMKNLFLCSSGVPAELLYLELGLWPIRNIVMKRKCLYLHHILQQSEDSLLSRFFLTQMKNPRQGDWVSQVLTDLNRLNIKEELEQIGNMKKETFSSILNDKIHDFAFIWLLKKKKAKSPKMLKEKI